MKKPIITTLFLLVLTTIFFGTIYTISQQVVRIGANDPQIQMAEDIATGLTNGAVPASFMPADRSSIDMSQSLGTFVMIFDDKGTLLESSAYLHNNTVLPPTGTFDYTKANGEDRFTWQPEVGVRNATVLKYYGGAHPGFVLVGRSLREVEIRENDLRMLVGFAWIVACILIIGFSFWYNRNIYEAPRV